MYKSVIFILFFFLSTLLTAKELEPITLQLKWKYQFQFAGFIAAKEKGFYKEMGYDVKIQENNASRNIISDIENKIVDFGVTDSSLVLERMRGRNVVAMMAIFQHSPFVLLTLKSNHIEKLSDINGKRISLDEKIHGVAIKAMLKSNHIKYSIKPATIGLDKLLKKETDLINSYLSNEPFIAKEQGLEIVTFNPEDYGFAGYGDILFCSKEMLKMEPKKVQKFYDATKNGWEYAFEHIDEMVDIIYNKYNTLNKSKKALKYEANVLKKLSGYNKNFGKIDEEKIKAISQVFNFMIKEKYSFNYINGFIFKPNSHSNLILSNEEKLYLKKKKKLNVCVPPNYDKKLIGYHTDFMKIVSKKIKTQFNLVPTSSWHEALSKLENKECDTLSMTTKAPLLNKTLLFTSPYLKLQTVIATKTDAIYINNIKNKLDKKFAMLKGSPLQELVKAKYPELKIINVDSIQNGLKKVADGKAYGYIDNSIVIVNEIRKNFFSTLGITGNINIEVPYSIGTSNHNKLLNSIFNKVILSIDNTEIQEIENRWLIVSKESFIDYNLIKKVVIIFLIISLLGAGIILILRKNNQKLKIAKNEIKEFNKTLEEQIEKEVEKNQQQQFLLFQQSRLAQMGEMMSMIAHQWRQPLSSINATVMVMEMKLRKSNIDNNNILEDEFNDIELFTKHMSTTIDDFKNFFKPEKKKTLFNLKETIEHTIRIVMPILKHENIDIITDYERDFEILSYPNELGQVLLNIITNAKDALLLKKKEENREIQVTLFQRNKHIVISIKDNAYGIDQEIIDKIFNPYFSTKTKKNGTGLGLYISKSIIEGHMGGELSIESSSEGSTFEIRFPL